MMRDICRRPKTNQRYFEKCTHQKRINFELKISINGKDYKNFSLKSELKRSGCDFNKLVELEVFLPKNKTLVPFVDFKVLHNGDFYGFNSASLYKLLPKLKEKEGENNGYEDSEDSVLDIEGL